MHEEGEEGGSDRERVEGRAAGVEVADGDRLRPISIDDVSTYRHFRYRIVA